LFYISSRISIGCVYICMNFNKFVQPVRSLIRLGAVCGTKGCGQGQNQKRLVGGARVKKIKCLGKKKHHFLLHELYFSANQGGARAPVGTYLGAATGCG
jgi:hypothetical protein